MDKRKYIKKVSLVGDGGVGKTSLVRRYVLDVFSDEYIQTFGAKVTKKVVDVEDVELTMMIWDILGQKAQKSLHTSYYAGSNGALVVCDLTREETLLNIPEWIEDMRRSVGDIPIVPVANKADMGVRLSKERMDEIADIVGSEFILTSARTGEGVELAFERLSSRMMEKV
ncbi:MAG TPA: Rab family GTPase [Methanomassiliicoccales archaeon]|nr:Rab family GTPase [Methanomassiliicoccales archaeon]